MKNETLGLFFALFIFFAAACSNPGSAPTVDKNWIAFVQEIDGNREIFKIKVDGSGLTNLTNDPSNDNYPEWSPDGSEIAFITNRSGNNDLFVMKGDGAQPKNLSNTPDTESNLDWSPDGNLIVFECYEKAKEGDLCSVKSDGSGYKKIAASPADEGSPRWSPDGNFIAYTITEDGATNVYVMDKNGDNSRKITDTSGTKSNLEWSPEGTEIAYYSEINAIGKIYVTKTDGSETVCITPEMPGIWGPAYPQGFSNHRWSPDGTKLVYTYWIIREMTLGSSGSSVDMSSIIFVSNSDGTNPVRLSIDDNMVIDTNPLWSPDGKKIVFISRKDNITNLYLMNADGTEMAPLTNSEGLKSRLSW